MKAPTGKGSRSAKGMGPFIYNDPLDNHVVWPGDEEALQSFIRQPYRGMQHKLRNARSSHSEDALTWSCFGVLARVSPAARREALTDIWELTFGNRSPPEDILNGDIHIGKRYGTGESTEVDASIEGVGSLIFIEAKLYSPMSNADPANRKPHNQIERKLRVGLREAQTHNRTFYFILLDIAPLEAVRRLHPGASLADATRPEESGFLGKWTTAFWFARYKYGSRGSLRPLQNLLIDAGFPQMPASDVAKRLGWLTWADVFKSVLRTVLSSSPMLKGP